MGGRGDRENREAIARRLDRRLAGHGPTARTGGRLALRKRFSMMEDARGPRCVRILDFSEAGFASGWSADILVRSVPGLDTEADKKVRASRNRRCAPRCGRKTGFWGRSEEAPDSGPRSLDSQAQGARHWAGDAPGDHRSRGAENSRQDEHDSQDPSRWRPGLDCAGRGGPQRCAVPYRPPTLNPVNPVNPVWKNSVVHPRGVVGGFDH
jgi:hypothetical protein